jgi:hypothetical protein
MNILSPSCCGCVYGSLAASQRTKSVSIRETDQLVLLFLLPLLFPLSLQSVMNLGLFNQLIRSGKNDGCLLTVFLSVTAGSTCGPSTVNLYSSVWELSVFPPAPSVCMPPVCIYCLNGHDDCLQMYAQRRGMSRVFSVAVPFTGIP